MASPDTPPGTASPDTPLEGTTSPDTAYPAPAYPAPVAVTPPPPEVQQPVPPPRAYPARPRKDPDRVSGIAFLSSGLALFGSTYLASSLIGVASIDLENDDTRRSRAYGNRMLIPVVGPWIAAPKAGSATGAWFTGLLGVAQAAGVALTTVGAVRLGRAHRRRVEQVSVGSHYLPGGGNVSLSFRF